MKWHQDLLLLGNHVCHLMQVLLYFVISKFPSDLQEKLKLDLDLTTELKPLNHPAWSRKLWRTKSASCASTSSPSELSDVEQWKIWSSTAAVNLKNASVFFFGLKKVNFWTTWTKLSIILAYQVACKNHWHYYTSPKQPACPYLDDFCFWKDFTESIRGRHKRI